ncbi:hypothetical protein FHY03_001218 [Sphingomonas sp. BK345]|nr:hypothetical protein [Sphingomonas sp. BK345]
MRLPVRLTVLLVVCATKAQAVVSGSEQRVALSGVEVTKAFTGFSISYAPSGWADAGIHEEYHKGGIWRGFYYSRGPVPFAGKWRVSKGQLCVSPDTSAIVSRWFVGERCRTVWRDKTTGRLLVKHLNPRLEDDTYSVQVRDLRR